MRTSEQLRGIEDRAQASCAGAGGAVAGPLTAVLAALREHDVELPMTTRWHGDLTPWNCARDDGGQLWVWDWESSEPDAVAGMDPLHWVISVRRESMPVAQIRLTDLVADAAGHLRAVGIHPEHWPLVAGVYTATVLERAADLATRAGSWDSSWIATDELSGLANQAIAALR